MNLSTKENSVPAGYFDTLNRSKPVQMAQENEFESGY
jgi:hypothetical protein